ncbi:MAG: YlxR family protein, partial [Deltaproteobacteria bacterium]|nr:YlxR family protein [Deltaproteobacteria bacterium]
MAIPERTCVGCGEKLPATALVRLRLVESGVAVDRERGGGRGAWMHAGGACLARAVKRKGFARAF